MFLFAKEKFSYPWHLKRGGGGRDTTCIENSTELHHQSWLQFNESKSQILAKQNRFTNIFKTFKDNLGGRKMGDALCATSSC